jgi:hypothetical protein
MGVGQMRNVLAIILLFLVVSTTAHAEGVENNYKDILFEKERLVTRLFYEANMKFGDRTRVSSMLSTCGDKIRSEKISDSLVDIRSFVMDKIMEKYQEDLKDFSGEQVLTIVIAVNQMYVGYMVGYNEASKMSKVLDEKNYCRAATDLYYEIQQK